MSDLVPHLRARHRELTAHFTAQKTSAWRIYDGELPEHPCAIDWYDGAAVAYAHAGSNSDPDATIIAAALNIAPDLVFVKERRRQRDRQHGGQYQTLARAGAERTVRETGLQFAVNLSDYLDTGLFLDHRPLRATIRSLAKGKRVLNLFAYTGAFTVHAAAGGALATVTVDLSNTYLRWAQRNMDQNKLRGDHRMVKADCIRWLGEQHRERFDLIICDPPTFSNSKAMAKSWEIERDQEWLLWRLWNLLTPTGTAWFSTNKRDFAMTGKLPPFTTIADVTAATIDRDFSDRIPHRCWRLAR